MTQTTLPGTQREDHPDVEAICLEADSADVAWNEAGKRRNEKRIAISTILRQRNLTSYKFWVPRLGKHKIARLDPQDPKLVIDETDEGDGEIGQGIPTGGETSKPKAKGLKGLAAVAAADSNTNTEETADGDVMVPETSAPKAKKSSKRKGSAK